MSVNKKKKESFIIYTFGRFTVDTTRSELREIDKVVFIEPKVFDLLVYFCAHANQIVTKELLAANIWQNTIVTDNAITRAITKLRKALNDDSRAPKFLKTLPKKGYMFVCNVNKREHVSRKINSVNSKVKFNVRALSSLFLVIAIAALLHVLTGANFHSRQISIVPVIRDSFANWYPVINRENSIRAVIKENIENGRTHLQVRKLASDQIMTFSLDGWKLKTPAIDPSGSAIIVVAFNPLGGCKFLKLSLNWLKKEIEHTKILPECNAESIKKVGFLNDKKIFYNHKQSNSPYVGLYQLSIEQKAELAIPEPVFEQFKGVYFFDFSLNNKSLLLLMRGNFNNTIMQIIDIPTGKKTYKKELSYFLHSAILDEDSTNIIHVDEHPSYQLLKTSLDNFETTIIASISERIDFYSMIPDSSDVIFSAYLNNVDIVIYDLEHAHEDLRLRKRKDSFNSSVMDYLPQLNKDLDLLAFVSKRTGRAELWLYDIARKNLKQISKFEQKQRFFELAWSPYEERLLALSNNAIYLIDSNTKNQKKLNLPFSTMRKLNWESPNIIAFEFMSDSGQWQSVQFDILLESVISNESNVIESIAILNQLCNSPLDNNMSKENRYYFFCVDKNQSHFLAINKTTMQPTELFPIPRYFAFDVSDSRLVISKRESLSSDIMQTTSYF